MVVGLIEISLRMAGTESLKDKRRILRHLLERARQDFHVAISEVDDHDLWGNATLGAAYVTNDPAHADSVLDRVLRLFDERADVEVANVWREIDRR